MFSSLRQMAEDITSFDSSFFLVKNFLQVLFETVFHKVYGFPDIDQEWFFMYIPIALTIATPVLLRLHVRKVLN